MVSKDIYHPSAHGVMAGWQSPVRFLIVWLLSTVIYQSLGGYWASIITTIEEIYHLSSFQSGLITSFESIVTLFISLPLVYFGRSVHRPRFIFVLCLLKSIGTLMQIIPHILFRPSIDQLLNDVSEDGKRVFDMCSSNRTAGDFDECDGSIEAASTGTIFWFLFGRVFSTGYCAVYPISVVYMDEGLPKRSTVAYIGIITAVYAVGFAGGYILAAVCLSIPVIPFGLPEGVATDELPGAWWLGYLILSMLALMSSFLYLLFPHTFPSPEPEGEAGEKERLVKINISEEEADPDDVELNADDSATEDSQGRFDSIDGFLTTMKSIVTNPIIVLLSLAGGVTVFATEAMSSFMPLFMQEYYYFTPAMVSLIAGGEAFLSVVFGQIAGGLLIRHFDLNRLQCALVYISGVTIFCIGSTAFVFMKCPDEDTTLFQSNSELDSSFDLVSGCNMDCGCSDDFDPICASGVTYRSPCLAGCQNVIYPDDIPTFYNCSCISGPAESLFATGTVVAGFCREECLAWIFYILVGVVIFFVISAASNAIIVIILRSVAKVEQELAFSSIHIAMKVIGMIPGPIVFGWIIDQACLITSGLSCYEEGGGDCLLYDRKRLRQMFFGIPAAIFWTTLIPISLIVWTIWRQDKKPRNL